MLNIKLFFPPKNGQDKPETIQCSEPLVIIGANGSGKSKLGFWIEQHHCNPEKVHRISAQRLLDFSEYIQLNSLEKAEKEFRFGTVLDFQNWGDLIQTKKINRWQITNQASELSVTSVLNDYERVLSVLFAKKAQRDSQLARRVREMELEGKNERPEMLDSPDEIILRIWNDLLPHRQLVIEDGKITVSTSNDNTYHGREMSDGERVALYLMAQCLCVPHDSIVIIDEPEIHLHKSLMSKLWSKIEEAQPNCLFVYITHDIDFAASRVGSKKIWLKSYDGEQWNWDEVPESEDLPEPVLLEILGSRKKVLFVEGDKGRSLDYKLYQAMYPEFLIIPRGGCEKVIESTKAMRNNSALLHHVEAFGIIDMDYRSKDEIDSLKQYGIHSLEVAEIENILCVPEVLKCVATHLAMNPEEIEQKVSDFVIETLEKQLEEQVSRRSATEIEFRLNMFNVKAKGKAELTTALNSLITDIDIEQIYDKNMSHYQKVIDDKNYVEALRIYNNKGLSKMISDRFEFRSEGYWNHVIRLLSTPYKDAIISGLKQYAPEI